MSENVREVLERWPGYSEQSWSERFAELDKAFQHQQATIDGLIKQLVVQSNITQAALAAKGTGDE